MSVPIPRRRTCGSVRSWWVPALAIVLYLAPAGWSAVPPSDPNLALRNLPVSALQERPVSAPLPGAMLETAPLVDPAHAAAVLLARRVSLASTSIASETTITPEIQELARGLRNDPSLLYEFVRNNVVYTPVFGALRGATGTLLDRRGNDFDQSALLVALLRAAGYTASFVHGVISLSASETAAWLGTSNANAIAGLMGAAGRPGSIYVDGTGNLSSLEIEHVFVKVSIGGTDRVFDPSYKGHTTAPGIDLRGAMGFDAATFFTRATQGMSSGAGWVQNVNQANVRADLASLAGSLATSIRTTMPAASTSDVVGGRAIVPVRGAPLSSSLPYEVSRIATWTQVPVSHQTLLRIQHLGIDIQLTVPDIYAKRLTIFYSGAGEPVVSVDGDQVAAGNPTALGSMQPLILSVDHPYASGGGTYADDSQTLYTRVGGGFFISNAWDGMSRAVVERHQRRIAEYRASGHSDTSEAVLGETLAVLGSTWLAQVTATGRLLDQVSGCVTLHHHEIGLMGQTDAPWMDMPMSRSAPVSLSGDTAAVIARFLVGGGVASAFEWGAIAQMQPWSAVSTIKMVDAANSAGLKLYDATSATWSGIKPLLSSYASSTLSSIESFLASGYRVVLPQNGNQQDGAWRGVGYIAIAPSGTGMSHMIAGGLKGGYSNSYGTADPNTASENQQTEDSTPQHDQSKDPVDLVTGAALHAATDVTAGAGSYPFGLAFSRFYSSASRWEDGPVGRGFSHGYSHGMRLDSDGYQALGEDTPVDAAAAMAEMIATLDLLRGGTTTDRVVAATLAHRWLMDSLVQNRVTVSTPRGTQAFLRLPDGTYNPPPGSADVLTRAGDGSGTLRTKHGDLFSYGTDGRLLAHADPNGNTVTFTYTSGKLTSVSNGLGVSLALAYTGNRVTSVDAGGGRTVQLAYDGSGNLTSVTATGSTTTYSYDGTGRLWKVFPPGFPASPVVVNSYDDFDRVTTQLDARGKTWTYYHGLSRTEEVDPTSASRVQERDGRQRPIRGVDPLGRETTYSWDGQDRLVKVTLPEGNGEELEYDTRHNRTKRKLLPKGGGTALIESFTFDTTWNRMTSMTDPLGRTTTYTQDAKGNATKVEAPQVGGITPTFDFTLNSRGQATDVQGPEGIKLSRTYDGNGRLASATLDPGGLAQTISFEYDAAGNVTKVTNARGQETTYTFDAGRRRTQATAPLGAVTKLTRDLAGNVTKVERATGAPADPWETTTATYAPDSLLLTRTDPKGRTTTYAYDDAGRLWKTTDAASRTVEMRYDAAGRPYRMLDPAGKVVEEHTYSANGLLASLKDARGNVTAYTYDAYDRPSRVTYADASYEAFTYDAAGRVLTKRTRKGETITYAHDALDRIVSRSLPGTETATFGYDLAGRLTSMTGPLGTTSQAWDRASRLLSTTYPDGKVVASQYDANGNRTRLTYPDGTYVTYVYDALDRLSEIRDSGGALIASYTWDPLSRRTAISRANGAATAFTYGKDGDLDSLTHQFTGGASLGFGYTWDSSRQLTSVAPSDAALAFSPPGSSSHADQHGVLNQITSSDGLAFTHDANGNITSTGSSTFTFDGLSRLTGATGAGHTSTYAYDPLGRRLSKTVDGLTTRFVHDGRSVLAEYDGAGNLQRRFLPVAPGGEVAQVNGPGGAFFLHQDHLGSTIALSGPSGALSETNAYLPYGEPQRTSPAGNPLLFAGARHDAETGLYHLDARYYSPTLGRFLSPDPSGDSGGDLNLYSYAFGSPLAFVDPTGRSPLGYIVGGVIFIAVVLAPGMFIDRIDVANDPSGQEAGVYGTYLLVGPTFRSQHPVVQESMLLHERIHKKRLHGLQVWKTEYNKELEAYTAQYDYLMLERTKALIKGDTASVEAIDKYLQEGVIEGYVSDPAILEAIAPKKSVLGKVWGGVTWTAGKVWDGFVWFFTAPSGGEAGSYIR